MDHTHQYYCKRSVARVKEDTNYLRKKAIALSIMGDEVYASSVNWKRYTKGIPYKVVQGSGDDNALGILKFNFNNKYSVYLHDTNQRYFFSRSFRALSHGCVSVFSNGINWHVLLSAMIASTLPRPLPILLKQIQLKAWLSRKEKHVIPGKNKTTCLHPLFWLCRY